MWCLVLFLFFFPLFHPQCGFSAAAVELVLLGGSSSSPPFSLLPHTAGGHPQAQRGGKGWRAAARCGRSWSCCEQHHAMCCPGPSHVLRARCRAGRGCRQVRWSLPSPSWVACSPTPIGPSKQTVLGVFLVSFGCFGFFFFSLSRNVSGRKKPSVRSLLLENQLRSCWFAAACGGEAANPSGFSYHVPQAVPVISSCPPPGPQPLCWPCRSRSAPFCNLQ